MWKSRVERGGAQMTVWCMRIVCWISKTTHTHTHTLRICNLLFHCNNGCTNIPQYNVICPLSVVLLLFSDSLIYTVFAARVITVIRSLAFGYEIWGTWSNFANLFTHCFIFPAPLTCHLSPKNIIAYVFIVLLKIKWNYIRDISDLAAVFWGICGLKTAWPSKMGAIGCPENLATCCQTTPHNIPEEHRSQNGYCPPIQYSLLFFLFYNANFGN
jgi:hypothetical protein